MTEINLSFAIGLPPERAVEYFKQKGYAFSWDWHDMWQESHAKAFTVAKAMKMDILQDIHDAVEQAIKNGDTLRDFQKALEPKLKAKGWWCKVRTGDVPGFDPATGGDPDRMVQLGSPRRLETIYRTNMQTALMAGQYKAAMENVDNRPYWQYVAVMDNRTRPAHGALNGKVFRYDDIFWRTHFPPLGFRCRCRMTALTEAEVKKEGLTVSKGEDHITWEDRVVATKGDKAGLIEQVAVYHDPFTGMDIATDPGWSYNPGQAAWYPDLDKYRYDVAKDWVRGGLTGPAFAAFYEGVTGGNFPVAVLSEEYRNAISAETQAVLLSDETLAKNRNNHPELTLQDYQSLPQIISGAQVIIEKQGQFIVFVKQSGKYYFAVIKTTQNRDELYMTSFRVTGERDVKSEMKKGTVIKNEMF